MRIQHNITAMNSYRNYAANTKAVSKNLEKLSSGYRINRAGDDAAGLAISEKMRAQITGLKTAQKNAKDGISLIQTAEGALTEVHSMLNRMFELSEQSANGTYDNEVDRANLQKEVSALKTEMDRIADSSNFNGIKLLDGSLGGSSSSTSSVAGKLTVAESLMGSSVAGYVAATTATSTATINAPATVGDATHGDKFTMKLASSTGEIFEVTLTYDDGAVSGAEGLYDADGNMYAVGTTTEVDEIDLGDAFAAAFAKNDTLKGQFTITGNGDGSIDFVSKDKGANAPTIEMSGLIVNATEADMNPALDPIAVTKGEDAYNTFDTSDYLAAVGTLGWDKAGSVAAEDAIIDVNGQKFAVAKDADSAKALVDQFGKDLNIVMYTTDADKTATALKDMINVKTGLAAAMDGTDHDQINLIASKTTTTTGNGGGMKLQIGDTAESFNQLTVNVGDMHTSALGIKGVDIGTQAGASAAMDKIKTAINSVSSTRGDLGALQNRLDHTINNLAVMTENIQDAEATVRDTDVAEEMMAYTKNNILVQSAQAMLAQANQLPQGVLQLLG